MGFLTEGNTFSWEEIAEKPTDFVRKHGITQFLNIYRKVSNRTRDSLRWGDEIEYIIIKMDKEKKEAKLLLIGHEILNELMKEELSGATDLDQLWRPEYARYMIEGTPGQPFGSGGISDVTLIEASMIRRRKIITSQMKEDERVVTVANFPLLGAVQTGEYTWPETLQKTQGTVAHSLFTANEVIHPHFRFATLTANIRNRRGSKVEINLPLFKDVNTTSQPLPIPKANEGIEPTPEQVPFNIYADSMAFGMGCCCLQTTLQCCNIQEARYFYDQLAVMSPIMLALTAATPIFRGYLADTDSRWNIIAASVDDRTEEERGLKPLKNSKFVINKSRYDSVDCYISTDKRLKPEYNDLDLVYDKDICERLMKEGVDELLARHIAHLFIRDPLVIYRDKLLMDDKQHADHFENIQSTNWQTVRFKPPPPNSSIGWRVEFRPMEIQLTDFENAAMVVFTILLTRLMSSFGLNVYIPITKVDENLRVGQKKDAVTKEKFWFRRQLTRELTSGPEYVLMTIDEIMNGKTGATEDENFCGLIPLIGVYLDTINIAKDTRAKINEYLQLISKKASGELQTTAAYMRHFVTSHPDYKKDSVVSPLINYDLMEHCAKIGSGEIHPTELIGAPRAATK
eukprot:TRINITY_DN5307_c0_g1_i1.p1 TRINITY_DN5307_c0_g1~~TRINITY_DN5307_c0_g1_i1.p1  ORF type:complete len:627 (+),score=179.73 TRINITY_DN5307_c0_g1_i1:107-1987(+)